MENFDFKNSYFDNKKLSSKYINRYISLNCSEELQRYKMFPNVKEVTESMGMFNAAMMLGRWDKDIHRDKNVQIYVVGDGKRPRTAALFAFMTKWNCISIDPDFDKVNYPIDRLFCIKNKVENIHNEVLSSSSMHKIIILPHSHARIEDAYHKCSNDSFKTWIITMPCCFNHVLPFKCIEFRDTHIMSEKNLIKVYCNYMEPKFFK